MFCFQCEETAKGSGCTIRGVCGKESATAALQDLLVEVCKGIAQYVVRSGRRDTEVDRFIFRALFSTLTNVNFDPVRFQQFLQEAIQMRDRVRDNGPLLEGAASIVLSDSLDELIKQGEQVGIEKRKQELGEDIAGLYELIIYGLKGIAAYGYHASILGKESDEIYTFVHDTLAFLTRPEFSIDELFELAMKTGEINLKVMEILDEGNTEVYGHPEPTQVRVTPKKGKAILVSGHDLKDLEELLKQTEGKGINVYTHGEMLPCNAYPGLKKYPHLVGNYGGAWWQQVNEFDRFPGPIVMTTNCLQQPRDSYKERIFTTGVVGWPGVKHIEGYDFSPVIESALAADGFTEDMEEKYITIGFARNTVLGVADKVVEAVKSGAIRHFFLVGGCDGRKKGREYYTEFVRLIPDDCVVLTLGCAKYRINNLKLGEIGGIPRLLDCGQCNDAYSAIQIAIALAKAFDTDINSLPLSLNVAWYEQKAVAILLTLLYLGIKNIKLGPSLPAFISPSILDVLVERFNISGITTPEEDLKQMLGKI